MIRKEIDLSKDIKNIKFGSIIHKIELYDDESKALKECNKKINLIIIKGMSKDKRYAWYPYWSVEIQSEQGDIITWTPTKKLTLSFMNEFLIHESRVDMTRNRKSDTSIYKKHIQNIILNVQKTLNEFNIPAVYKTQNEKTN